ncbi:MAG: hypothetical protein HDT15_10900 [Oscillibacter sp.]|nr:hypothetical protein [Oscillibacter sp.]MBD5155542.1 hypothetical protein [Oscillibacter sp.]
MKKLLALILAAALALSLVACGGGKAKEDAAKKAAELLSGTTWGHATDAILGNRIYHLLVFSKSNDVYGDVEFAIQYGDTNTFQARGRYTVSTKDENIVEVKYDEQLKDGTWGPVEEGRTDSDKFCYVIDSGEITELYRVDKNGDATDIFIKLD